MLDHYKWGMLKNSSMRNISKRPLKLALLKTSTVGHSVHKSFLLLAYSRCGGKMVVKLASLAINVDQIQVRNVLPNKCMNI